MDPISIALALAQFAPTIMKYFGVGQKSIAVAEKTIEIAKQVTGTDSGESAISALKADPALQLKFQEDLLAQDLEFEKLYYADMANARARDASFIEHGTHNYRADFLSVLAVIIVLIVMWQVWKNNNFDEYQQATITLVLGRFLGYIDQIFQFEFGSTRTSKSKDETIVNLSSNR